MTFYDKNESREIQTLPPSIPWGYGIKRNIPAKPITMDEYRQAGFVLVIPAVVQPSAVQRIKHRTLVPEGDDMREVLVLWTVEEAEAAEAEERAAMPPEPSPVVLDIDSNTGEASGKTYRAICVDGILTSTLNSASPQRPGTEQIAGAVAKRKAQKLAIGSFGKGQLQRRIEALEAWVMAQEERS